MTNEQDYINAQREFRSEIIDQIKELRNEISRLSSTLTDHRIASMPKGEVDKMINEINATIDKLAERLNKIEEYKTSQTGSLKVIHLILMSIASIAGALFLEWVKNKK